MKDSEYQKYLSRLRKKLRLPSDADEERILVELDKILTPAEFLRKEKEETLSYDFEKK